MRLFNPEPRRSVPAQQTGIGQPQSEYVAWEQENSSFAVCAGNAKAIPQGCLRRLFPGTQAVTLLKDQGVGQRWTWALAGYKPHEEGSHYN